MKMKCTFSEYLAEANGKNTHLEHLEDEVLNNGINGTRAAIMFLLGVRDMLAGHTKSPVSVTVKWDGAPAIIAGINPENGKFFVGTKSVFNKTPKLNYTDKDIDENHPSEGLANKLKIALSELSKLGIRGVLQGDFLYSKEDLKLANINGVKHIIFRPNTITYAVPYDSDLGRKILRSKIGIVFHTTYSGRTIQTLKAFFGADVSSLRKIPSVWVTDASFRDESGSATMTAEETAELNAILALAGAKFREMDSQIISSIVNDASLILHIKTYNNAKVRAGEVITNTKRHVDEIISYLRDRYEAQAAALKTERGKEARRLALTNLIQRINQIRPQLVIMFDMQNLLVKAKEIIIRKLQRVKTLGTFLQTADGFKVTNPEGFVAVDHIGNAVKLVDRLEFSRANFTIDKNWS